MVDTVLNTATNGTGEQLIAPLDPSDKTPWLDPQTEHSVARVFSADTTSFPAHVYTNKVKATYIDISKKKSTCSVIIQDKTIKQIAEYENNYGIGLNSNIDGFDYLIVVHEDSKANIKTSGSYGRDKVVLFSGYNRGSYSLDNNELRVTGKYVGIEEKLNEIKIDGLLEVNHWSGPSEENLNGKVGTHQVSYYDTKTIFNEKSSPDKYIGELLYDVTTFNNAGNPVSTGSTELSVADKSGLQETSFWNCKDILDYLIGVYIHYNPDIRRMLDQADRINYLSKFIRFDYGSISRSDLSTVVPMDFNITGMGLLDAIYKVIDTAKKYSISKRYDQDGVAVIGLRANNKAQRILDNDGDVPLKLQIGKFNAPAVRLDNVDSANLNINRENKQIGRVIVRGGHLHINTLVTTWGKNTVDPVAANGKKSTSQASNSSDFSTHCHLLTTDYNESKTGVPEQTYVMLNTAMVGDLLDLDLGMNVSEFNETHGQEIFKSEKTLKIKPYLFLPYGNSNGRKKEDIGVYVPYPFETASGKFDVSILYLGVERLFIQPIVGGKEDGLKIAIKYSSENFGEFKVYSNADKNDDGRTEHRFKEYINSSLVPPAAKYPANRGVASKEIPLYIRCAVKTDYRIRGIAKIPGYDSEKHDTHYVDDKDDLIIALQYKDKKYDGSGGWINLADGWIDGEGEAEKKVLADLQSKAQAELDLITNVANSGYCELNGCQFVKPGDMVDEFEETDGSAGTRGFDFEAIINKVGLDLRQRKTIINFGAKFG